MPRRRASRTRGRRPWGERTAQIIVPLDGSREAKVALVAARLIAEPAQASILLVHAAERSLSPEELVEKMQLSGEEIRGTVVQALIGKPSEAIVRVAVERQTMLIVMTTRGATAYLGRTVRPVVEEVVVSSPCPVLLVRPETLDRIAAMRGFRSLLLPLDGAPSSAAVIGPALDLARRAGAAVDILYVACPCAVPREKGTLTAPRYVDQPQHEWSVWAREFGSRFGTALGTTVPPAPTHVTLRTGQPAAEILRYATERGSDLIVLEWRGRLDPEHAQVVRQVLRDSPCPVLLLRTDQAGGRR